MILEELILSIDENKEEIGKLQAEIDLIYKSIEDFDTCDKEYKQIKELEKYIQELEDQITLWEKSIENLLADEYASDLEHELAYRKDVLK